jgi:hypothetical protein
MLCALLVAVSFLQEPVKDLIHVPVPSAAAYRSLQTLLTDVDDHHAVAREGYAIAYATDAEQAALTAAGIGFAVQIEDLQAHYAARAAAELGPRGPGVGSMGGFRTLAEILAEMDRLAAVHPAIVSPRFSIGTSLEGRAIWAFRISTTPAVHDPSKPVAWFDAIHHAREPMSGESLLHFADWLCANQATLPEAARVLATRNVLLIPCANPDGYEYNRQIAPGGGGMWRKNRRNNGDGTFGVDLNRNYAWEWGPQWPGSSSNTSSETYRGTAPFSEPETQRLRDLLALQTPTFSMSCHTYGDVHLFSWGYDTIVTPDDPVYRAYGAAMTAENGYATGTIWELLYIANGGSVDYHYGQHGTIAYTPEIGNSNDGFWPAPSRIPALQAATLPMHRRAAQYAGAWASIVAEEWSEVTGDGDDDREPGESWSLALRVRNEGVLPLSGSLALASSDPLIQVSGGPLALNAAPRAEVVAGSFTLDFDAQAAIGTPYALDLDLLYEGHASTQPLALVLGGVRVLARDDMESGAWGWSSNNATNWSWERAVPQATSTGGQTAQPGTDHSPSGTRCWVTGAAAGSSAGTNDVDGVALLTSAPMNLSEFSTVELAYWRWFANLPGGPLDDRFRAEVSPDGGATWVLLEESAHDNQWRERAFALEQAIPLTNRVVLRFRVADDPNNDITEGLLDDLELRTRSAGPTLFLYGPAQAGAEARFSVGGAPQQRFDLAWASARTNGSSVGGIAGQFFLGANYRPFASGVCDGEGLGVLALVFPPGAAGRTLHFQGVAGFGTPDAAFTNALTLSFP